MSFSQVSFSGNSIHFVGTTFEEKQEEEEEERNELWTESGELGEIPLSIIRHAYGGGGDLSRA